MGGLSLRRLDLSSARGRDDFDRLIQERCAQLPQGQWLEAFGWNDANWPSGKPDHSWLRTAGDRPAIAWRCDQHVALVNHAVMRLLDLHGDPPGGTIARDTTGSPTGLLIEQAAWKLLIPRIPVANLAQRQQASAEACEHLLSLGVTAAGAMEYLDDIETVLAPARDMRALRVRVRATVLDRERPLPFARANAIRSDDVLSIIGFKSFADGTLGSSTAAMIDPYSDATGSGSLMEHALADQLTPWMREVIAEGYSPAVHAIGDRGLSEVLRSAMAVDATRIVRFEHAQTVDPDSLAQFKGRFVSMQPFHKVTDAPLAAARLGAHRQNRVFQFREFLRHGARLAFGSDWPIVTANPLEGMRAAITGIAIDGQIYGANQNLTAHEAITAYTNGAADALGDWKTAGRINQGCLADFVVLDRNPLTCDWASEAPRVMMTIVGGEVRYEARSRVTSMTRMPHA